MNLLGAQAQVGWIGGEEQREAEEVVNMYEQRRQKLSAQAMGKASKRNLRTSKVAVYDAEP